jgi:hypothetical protein
MIGEGSFGVIFEGLSTFPTRSLSFLLKHL